MAYAQLFKGIKLAVHIQCVLPKSNFGAPKCPDYIDYFHPVPKEVYNFTVNTDSRLGLVPLQLHMR